MNKKEILKKSQQENTAGDERENQVKLKAINISRSVGFVLCFLILLLETIFLDSCIIGFACLTMSFCMRTTECWITILTLKDKKFLVDTIIETAFFIACSVIFIGKLL